MDLTHHDVLEILALLDAADVEHFELRTGDTVIVAGRGPAGASVGEPATALAPPAAPPPVAEQPYSEQPGPERSDLPTVSPAAGTAASMLPPTAPADETTTEHVDVPAPVVGVFYRAPEPGAPPYAEVGGHVDAGDTLGLVEVMKMFTGVTAPVGGTVVEALAADGEFVEYGQALIRILPDHAAR